MPTPCNDIEVERIHITRKEFDELTSSQWLPIESAPKDGTAVLVGADCYPVQPASAMWVSDYSASACAPGWFINSVGNDMLGGRLALIPLDYEPTSWQPLHPPPTQ